MLGLPNRVCLLKTLSDVDAGRKVRIVKIEDKGELAWRLALMGFVKNCIIEVIHNDGKGPLIVGIDGSRVAVGRKIAGVVFVEDLS